MTFDEREAQGFGVEGVECFLFKQGATRYGFTSSDRAITLPAFGEFLPATISCSDISHSNEDGEGSVEVSLERTNPVALLFQRSGPMQPVRMQILVAHEDYLSEARPWWSGRAVALSPSGPSAILSGVTAIQLLQKAVSAAALSKLCARHLYSPECGAHQASFTAEATLSAVAGRVVTSATFGAHVVGWYTGGKLATPSGKLVYVVNHVGNNLTLLSVIPELQVGSKVLASAGCDHLHDTCEGKFHNGVNSLALKWAALKNPFLERVS